jgi:beta-phosphoglucomutase-like phosphatase (HAD superfamily)
LEFDVKKFQTIKVIALDLDGPLLVDTFSPLMFQICKNYGIEYTRDVERNTFSRKRSEVIEYFREKFKEKLSDTERAQTDEEMFAGYFRMRAEYMQTHKVGMKPEVPAFLERVSRMGVRLICYGGLEESYMKEHLGVYADLFEPYICTNEFRPGVRQIVHEICKVQPNEVLFVDDVNFVAEHVRDLGASFIGIPSAEPWSWQRKDMTQTGARYIFDSVTDISDEVLQQIDQEAFAATHWR